MNTQECDIWRTIYLFLQKIEGSLLPIQQEHILTEAVEGHFIAFGGTLTAETKSSSQIQFSFSFL